MTGNLNRFTPETLNYQYIQVKGEGTRWQTEVSFSG